MNRALRETTTEQEAAQGVRTFVAVSQDAADRLTIEIKVKLEQEVSLAGDPLEYVPTGNLCHNGTLVDELLPLLVTLNEHRPFTHLPEAASSL